MAKNDQCRKGNKQALKNKNKTMLEPSGPCNSRSPVNGGVKSDHWAEQK